MQLESIRYFLAVAEWQSLHKAAEVLHMTQPALSKSMRHLEEELGVSLFLRSSRGMVLTDAGRMMLEKSRPIYEQWRTLYDEIRAAGRTSAIRLGALPSLAAYYLPMRIAQTPEPLRISTLTAYSTSRDGMEALQRGEIDAMIGQADCGLERSSVWRRELFTEPYCVVTASDHPLNAHPACSLQVASQHPLIVHPTGCDVRSAVFRCFSRQNLTPRIAMEVPFNESLLAFVAAGMGITIVPNMLSHQALRMGLKVLPMGDPDLVRQIAVMARDAQIGRWLHQWLRPTPASDVQEQIS